MVVKESEGEAGGRGLRMGGGRVRSPQYAFVRQARRCLSVAASAGRRKESAIVLLSGGLDSSTVLAIAKRNYRCHALSFDYGQRHRYELEAAREIAKALGVEEHRTMYIDLRAFGQSALTSDDISVPKVR